MVKYILYRYKNRSQDISKLNFYEYISSRFFKDKVIHPQFFGFKINNDYPPGEIYSKLRLTMHKSWINNVDEILDKSMRNPKDSISSKLCSYMSDKAFSKIIMMHILRAKISLYFQQTEERNIGFEYEHSPPINHKNKLWL